MPSTNVPIPNAHHDKRTLRVGRGTSWLLASCIVLSLLLAACGPRDGLSADERLVADTVEIAHEYVQSSNLDQARNRLDTLEVANPNQWLVLTAENHVIEEADHDDTLALVQLALALNMQSDVMRVFAETHGVAPVGVLGGPEPLAEAPAPAQASLAAPVSSEAPAVGEEQAPLADAGADLATAGEVQASADAPQTETETVDETVADDTVAPPDPTPTNTPDVAPVARAQDALNVRAGPGLGYSIVGALNANAEAAIVGKNPQADWWQVLLPTNEQGWVLASLVATVGDTAQIAVAQNIPELPPTATPAPIVAAPAEQAPVEQPPAEQPPAEQAPPAEEVAEAPPEAAPPPATSGNDFVLVERRLWDVYENGGSLNGPSVTCGEKHELFVTVIDANGNPLNGVAVQSVYNGETFVTGDQGKGDGVVEYILWGEGQGVKVARDVDGREVSSDTADGLTPRSPNIAHEDLISARYCTDTASCNKFNESAGCWGHHSWDVTFQRKY